MEMRFEAERGFASAPRCGGAAFYENTKNRSRRAGISAERNFLIAIVTLKGIGSSISSSFRLRAKRAAKLIKFAGCGSPHVLLLINKS